MNPFEESQQYFPTVLQQAQYFDKYSRYRYDLGRREAWVETVERVVDFLKELSHTILPTKVYDDIREGILRMDVMPSMRLLATAGEAARRQNMSVYNCSALTIDSISSFVEVMLACMAGTGVGYSVEQRNVRKLPTVAYQNGTRLYHLVGDTTECWGEALRIGLEAWFNGQDVEYCFDLVRPAGAPLRTKGGQASGPEPLKQALSAIRSIILARQGLALRPIDAHDIACWVASASISGGHRRAALIALFDWDDQEMLNAKAGAFWEDNPQRSYANNSAVIEKPLTREQLEHFFGLMHRGGTGEPGLFSRLAARQGRPERRSDGEFLLNPLIYSGASR